MNFFSSVLAFLSKYAVEMDAVSTTLNAILDALPIQQQDRDNIKAELAKVANVGNSIRDFLENKAPDLAPTPVNIDAADVERAVGSYLTTHVGDATQLVEAVVASMKEQGLVLVAPGSPANNPDGVQ